MFLKTPKLAPKKKNNNNKNKEKNKMLTHFPPKPHLKENIKNLKVLFHVQI
jgi:hypothetical protein